MDGKIGGFRLEIPIISSILEINKRTILSALFQYTMIVRMEGVEPMPAALDPKSSASASFATSVFPG